MVPLRSARLAAPHGANAAIVTGVSVSVALSAGPAAAAAVATAAAAGGLAGSFTTSRLPERLGPLPAPLAASLIWAASSTAAVLAAHIGANTDAHPGEAASVLLLTAMAAGAFSWITLSILIKGAVATWGTGWLRRMGPVGRVGAAGGALLGAAAADAGELLWLLAVLPLSAAAPVFTRATAGRGAGGWQWGVFRRNLALAVAGYGPLTLHVAFVAATAGARWAGASMAVYAAAALAAPNISAKIPADTLSDRRTWLALAAVADLAWLATLAHPLAGLMFARALAAICLFVAEGAAEVDAHAAGAVTSSVAGRLSGGVLIGAVGTALLSAGLTVAAVATLFATGAVSMVAALSVPSGPPGRRKRT